MGLYWVTTRRGGHVVRAGSITEAKHTLRKALLARDSTPRAGSGRLDWPLDEQLEGVALLDPEGPAMVLVHDPTNEEWWPHEDGIVDVGHA